MSKAAVRVALVGHCGPDSYMLKSAIRRAIDNAEVVSVDDERSLKDEIGRTRLLVLNRVLDGRFSTESGVELIRRLKGAENGEPAPAMLLVSNYEDAQAEAEAAGAHPGFGKAQVHAPETAERLRRAAGVS